ncbi:MAG: hypothetical protein U0350_02970 [Caldilineaceae bacterium]
MALHEVLIMAMTRMRSGICTAGFINEPHPASHLRWVRPVKEFGALLIGDMSQADGRVVQVGDVVELNLIHERPDAPHCEDWVTDFVKKRPHIVRQSTGQAWSTFLDKHCDKNPTDVLQEHSRSLCLLRPQTLWANFALDAYSGNYEARLGFQLAGHPYPETSPKRGLPVTDLKWRALGRSWLAQAQAERSELDNTELHERLQAEAIYLSIGLSRSFEGKIWPLIIGVYPIPDYAVCIDYNQP